MVCVYVFFVATASDRIHWLYRCSNHQRRFALILNISFFISSLDNHINDRYCWISIRIFGYLFIFASTHLCGILVKLAIHLDFDTLIIVIDMRFKRKEQHLMIQLNVRSCFFFFVAFVFVRFTFAIFPSSNNNNAAMNMPALECEKCEINSCADKHFKWNPFNHWLQCDSDKSYSYFKSLANFQESFRIQSTLFFTLICFPSRLVLVLLLRNSDNGFKVNFYEKFSIENAIESQQNRNRSNWKWKEL